METKNKKPEYQVKVGAVQLSVFSNEIDKNGTTIPMKSIKVIKRYTKDGSNWESTNNYNINDLFKLQIGIQQVLKQLLLNNKKDNNNEVEEETVE